MIKATFFPNQGKKYTMTFNTVSVRDVYNACKSVMGRAYKNTIFGNKVRWNFEDGFVVIDGYCHFGNRIDSARITKEERLVRKGTRR